MVTETGDSISFCSCTVSLKVADTQAMMETAVQPQMPLQIPCILPVLPVLPVHQVALRTAPGLPLNC